MIFNNDTTAGKACTNIHEQSHINDWIKRYGPNSCRGKPKGYFPSGSINGDDYRDFLRDSECRAYEASKQCDEACNDPYVTKRREQNVKKNYCESYDTWRNK